MQNSHVILIIVMATHCRVCGSRMQQRCGLICAASALSHEKSHAVNLIGAPEIRTATSSSPRNRSSTPDPLPRVGVGSGTETIEHAAFGISYPFYSTERPYTSTITQLAGEENAKVTFTTTNQDLPRC